MGVVTVRTVENVTHEDPPPFEARVAKWTSPHELGYEDIYVYRAVQAKTADLQA